MKVLPFKIPRNFGEAIMVKRDRQKYLYDTLHQHPELQIIYVKEGAGTAVIGGHIGTFNAGDVFVVGSNIPHVFRNDEVYYLEGSDLHSEVVYLFLDEKLPKNDLLNFVEVKEVFHSARQGFRLDGFLKEKVGYQMDNLPQTGSLDRFLEVLDILNEISKSPEVICLNSEVIKQRIDEGDGKRLNDVIQYTFKHYADKITLNEVSEIANMVPSAFCRFFKQRTQKTYFDFLNEIRIRNACKLLLNKDKSIVEICFQSGFNNLSHFNRKFKDMTGYSPLKYHKAIKGK